MYIYLRTAVLLSYELTAPMDRRHDISRRYHVHETFYSYPFPFNLQNQPQVSLPLLFHDGSDDIVLHYLLFHLRLRL